MHIINSALSVNNSQISQKRKRLRIITRDVACLNRWQNHGSRSLGQAVSLAGSVVVALVSH